MKITTLMEDTACFPCICAEHGLSFWIETEEKKIIMDTGASGLTWENAKALGIDPAQADAIIISHGHYDHAGGLMALTGINTDASIYMRASALGDYFHGERYIGIDKAIASLETLRLIEEDETEIDGSLSLFSGVTGRRLWPEGNRLLSEKVGGVLLQDEFRHEQCLVVREGGKSVLFSGCAHNGILNILDRYRCIYGGFPDYAVSGFHMMKSGEYTTDEKADIEATARELMTLPTVFYTGHCTGKPAFGIMKDIMGENLHAFGAGDVFFL